MATIITRDQIRAIDPSRDAADVVADINAAAFRVGAPYVFQAVGFDALGLTVAWAMNPSLVSVLRANPDVLKRFKPKP